MPGTIASALLGIVCEFHEYMNYTIIGKRWDRSFGGGYDSKYGPQLRSHFASVAVGSGIQVIRQLTTRGSLQNRTDEQRSQHGRIAPDPALADLYPDRRPHPTQAQIQHLSG